MYGSVADYDLSRPYTSMVLNIPAVGYQATVAKQERFNVQEAINGDVELKEKQEKTGTWKWLSIPASSTGRT